MTARTYTGCPASSPPRAGESLWRGKIAVGNVVLNRVKSSSFPNSVKEVVFDDRYAIQFEPVANGTVYDRPTESALLAAKLCLEGAGAAGDSLYFFAPALSRRQPGSAAAAPITPPSAVTGSTCEADLQEKFVSLSRTKGKSGGPARKRPSAALF